MAHIHELIDFVVSIQIVHNGKILMIHHKGLNRWLAVGGHVELNEDPESAAVREAKEESGLDIELVGSRPAIDSPGTRMLIPPTYLDIHDIKPGHRHIGMVYIARAKTDQVTLAPEEHYAIRWFTPEDLEDPQYAFSPSIKFYATEALRIVGELN
jgi:8-oxo-dGTP pyrophosphatase MutT (NUDIX family)